MRLLIFLFLTYIITVNSQKSCSSYTTSQTCNFDSGGACRWYLGSSSCRCISEVKLDILFALDTSGSIGFAGFQIQKQFVTGLVKNGVNNGSRIGFYMFSTEVNASKGIQFWDTQELVDYTEGIWWKRGWTNTPQLVTDMLAQFAATKDDSRQQILMLVTDGNPCLPESRGGCPKSVCNMETTVKSAGVRVIVIGVGDALVKGLVDCLISNDEDWIPVDSYSTDDFLKILGTLSGVLCPISKNCKVTEVKAMRKPPGWSAAGEGRYTRFIEIYNTGVDFDLSELKLTGLVNMAAGPAGVVLKQGQYLVFYDAADLPATTYDGTSAGPSVPTCHACGSDCGLDSCSDSAKNNPLSTTEYCFCDNSIYIACGNTGGTADSTCPATGGTTGLDDMSSPVNSATDGCNVCDFNNNMDKTNWNIYLWEHNADINVDDPIDKVVYGEQGFWIQTEDRFAYELISKGYDNDIGDNWGQTCSKFGTPGANPYATCDTGCISDTSCGLGGNCTSAGNCYCDPALGLYAKCAASSTGNSVTCTKCAEVPGVDDCDVYWTKNGTIRNAAFNWTRTSYNGEHYYKVTFFNSVGGKTESPNEIYDSYWSPQTNYDATNFSYGGWVQTCIPNDIVIEKGPPEVSVTTLACSAKTWCNVYTARPTISPTPEPTPDPTPIPSPMPTVAPTWACPRYWFTGGTSQGICDEVPNKNADYTGGDRCACHGSTRDQCCLLEPDFTTTHDANRKHKSDSNCKEDVELYDWKTGRTDEDDIGNDGYLLTTEQHTFTVDISPDNYPCRMDIFWRLKFDCLDDSYTGGNGNNGNGGGNGNSGGQASGNCAETGATLSDAGLEIVDSEGNAQTSGWLKVWGQNDVQNTTLTFTVRQGSCEETSSPATTATRRRLGSNCARFESIAIYGVLEMVNATSECQPDCADYRIYPMRIPVWYNYNAAFVAPPGQEKELPAWLWWLVAALVIFLALLAFLLYRYWWKNKKTGAALGSVQADLDAAVMEQEMGFGAGLQGNAVGFNPLATGFNPNAPAGGVGPNAPPDGGAGGGDFIRPNVEKPVFKQHYGPQMGNMGGGGGNGIR